MFNQRIFEPYFIARGQTRNSSVVVTGFAHHYNELVLLNAVGTSSNIDMLLAAARQRSRSVIITINHLRTALMREENTEFDFEIQDIPSYGIKSVVIANRQLTRPDGRRSFFAAENDADAAVLVGERIKAHLPNSVLPAWHAYLLSKGAEHDYIRRLPGQGVAAYYLDTDREFWQSVISSGIASGALTF